MAVEVLKELKHDGVLHKAGAIIHNLTEDVKAELVKLGVVKDLEAVAGKVEEQAKEDLHTAEDQLKEDEELARGQVETQVEQAVNQDVEDAKATLEAEGQPVSHAGQPTPQQIASDPQLQ